MNNNLNKKRERDDKSVIITIGKHKGSYYYLRDTCESPTTIKITIEDTANKLQDTNSQSSGIGMSMSNIGEIPHIVKAINNNQTQPLYLPASSSWFDINNIHEIEMQTLPEFFCGKYPSKTPQIYKEYRNFIINLYRENPKAYLSATVCRRHLAGDACSILRIHGFLEHWGIINFKVEPMMKPVTPFLPKAFNFKAPVYIEASSLVVMENNSNLNKIGNNNVIITNKNGEELAMLFPINNHPENLFKSFLNGEKSVNPYNQVHFLAKNYRPKCDKCDNLCGLDWYITTNKNTNTTLDFNEQLTTVLPKQPQQQPNTSTNTNTVNSGVKNDIPSILVNYKHDGMLLFCETCYEQGEFPKGLTKDDFELSNVFNIFTPDHKFRCKLKDRLSNEEWSEEETKTLMDAIETHNSNWDEIAKVFEGKRTKTDCIIHFMQLPLKDRYSFKVTEQNTQQLSSSKRPQEEINAVNDQSNPLISQLIFFVKMFEKYTEHDKQQQQQQTQLEQHDIPPTTTTPAQQDQQQQSTISTARTKEIIYKTYNKSVSVAKALENEETKEMNKIMDMLIYLQMKKIELKLNYFNECEKMIHLENQQLKTMESQIIQDRIKFVIKKNELLQAANKLKELQKIQNANELVEKIQSVNIKEDTKVIELINNVKPYVNKQQTNDNNVNNGDSSCKGGNENITTQNEKMIIDN